MVKDFLKSHVKLKGNKRKKAELKKRWFNRTKSK